VLVSRTVKDLVAGSGLRFADRGSQTLKGVPGDWQIYAVERRRSDTWLGWSGSLKSLRMWQRLHCTPLRVAVFP
jgi:hypothetical protein